MKRGQSLTGNLADARASLVRQQHGLNSGQPGRVRRLVERQGGAEHTVAPVGLAGDVFADDRQSQGGKVFLDLVGGDAAVETDIDGDVTRGVDLRAERVALEVPDQGNAVFGCGASSRLGAAPLDERTQAAPEVGRERRLVGVAADSRQNGQGKRGNPTNDGGTGKEMIFHGR